MATVFCATLTRDRINAFFDKIRRFLNRKSKSNLPDIYKNHAIYPNTVYKSKRYLHSIVSSMKTRELSVMFSLQDACADAYQRQKMSKNALGHEKGCLDFYFFI